MALSEREQRVAIAREWWFRAWAERESTERFRRLHGQLCDVEAPEHLRTACEDASADEARHAVLCADVARSFDDADPFEGSGGQAPKLGSSRLTQQERTLYEMVAFCCVTESMNAALLLQISEVAEDARVKEAARQLLRDEVQHAKLGWAYLAWVTQQGDSTLVVSSSLDSLLSATVSDNLSEPGALCASWSDPSRGYLSRMRRIELFTESVRAVIVPGLKHYGVDTALAETWLSEQAWLT